MKRFPWYLSVAMAAVCYYGLKHGGTLLLPPGHRLSGLFELFAPLAAIAWLLLAGKQLYDGVEPEQENNEGQPARNEQGQEKDP